MPIKTAAQFAYELGAQRALQKVGFIKNGAFFRTPAEEAHRKQLALDAANLATIGLPLGALGIAMGGHALEKRLTPANVMENLESKLRQSMEVPSDVKVTYGGKPLEAFFSPDAKTVRVSKETAPSVFSHEMGHASGKSFIHKYPQIYTHSRNLAGLALAPALISNLYTDPDSTAANIAKYAPGVLATPALYEEARASLRGLKGLSHVGGKGAVLRGLVPLLGAFGTYGSLAAAPIVGEKVMRKIME